VGLVEVTNLHYRELVDGFLEGKTVQDTFSDISRDSTLSHGYLDKLKSIYPVPPVGTGTNLTRCATESSRRRSSTLGLKSGEE
jgi:hypothetical protein